MQKEYDVLIWGSSLTGIKKALELAQAGHKVLVANKFGFPGGNATESLASIFELQRLKQDDFLHNLFGRVKKINSGVVFENNNWVVFHPEAVKRVCWNLLSNQPNLSLLFHVVPLSVSFESGVVELFGREGKIIIQSKQVLDFSDDKTLTTLVSAPKRVSLFVNCFFTDPLPPDIRGLGITRQIRTKIGAYVTSAIRNVGFGEVEKAFNNHLDLLSSQSWKQHQNRIRILPVYPEIKLED